jgi:CRISPR-associated exonuclease Cas4
MELESILSNYLSQPKIELGDRRSYIGASDVGNCPRKVVLSKTVPEMHDINTLIRFERGNLVETIIEKALEHSGVDFISQLEVKHPEQPFTAHLDFTFVRDDGIAVLEAKSVSKIPEEPYPSWVSQLYFQMGLVEITHHRPSRGGILAVDLNTGDFKLFNGYTHNPILFEGLLKKAEKIWASLKDGTPITTEKSLLCIYCPYRSDCSEYSTDGLPDLPIEEQVMDYQAAKAQEKEIKADVSRLRKELELAVQPYGEAKAGDYHLKLSTSTRTGFNSKAFKEEYPELAKEYMKTSSFTRLTVN